MDGLQKVVATLVAAVAFVLFVVLVFAQLGGFGPLEELARARRTEAEAARIFAEAERIDNTRQMIAQWPLVFAAAKDSVLVFIMTICNWLLLICLASAVGVRMLLRQKQNEASAEII